MADVEGVLASAAANRAETFRGVAAAVCAEDPGEAVLDSIWDMFMAMGPRGDDSLRDLATVDLRKEITSLEIPILLLHGRADAFVPFSAAEAVPGLNTVPRSSSSPPVATHRSSRSAIATSPS